LTAGFHENTLAYVNLHFHVLSIVCAVQRQTVIMCIYGCSHIKWMWIQHTSN